MLSVSARMGQSASRHNWLRILCQGYNEVLFFAFSHLALRGAVTARLYPDER